MPGVERLYLPRALFVHLSAASEGRTDERYRQTRQDFPRRENSMYIRSRVLGGFAVVLFCASVPSGWSQAACTPYAEQGPMTVWHTTHSHPACSGSSCTWSVTVNGHNHSVNVDTTLRGRTCCDNDGFSSCFQTVAKSTPQTQGPYWFDDITVTASEKVIESLCVTYALNENPDTQETSNQGACNTEGRCVLAYYHLEFTFWPRFILPCTAS